MTTLIATSGIAIAVVIIMLWLIEHLRKEFNVHSDIPTDQELNDLQNKLNRMALDRANERNNL